MNLTLTPMATAYRAHDHHQCRPDAEPAVGGGGHWGRDRVAVGRAQQLQPPLPCPLLGQQLLAGINREAVVARPRLGPDVAARPDPTQLPTIALPLAQQQGTTLLGLGHCQNLAQNGEQLQICPEMSWRLQTHTDTL